MPIITPVGGGNGGFQLVSCLAIWGATDIHAVGIHPLLIDALDDNTWDANPLTEIPAGLGLEFAFDGSSAAITTTESGIWAFTAELSLFGADATLSGNVNGNFSGSGVQFEPPIESAPSVCYAEVLALPAGANSGGYKVTTVSPATAGEYLINGTLSIVRLG